MKSITFFITKSDKVYTATAVEQHIITEASTLDSLVLNIEEAIALYFSDSAMPSPYTMVFSGVAETA